MRRTPEADLLTDLILEVFHLNGRLLAAGDFLTKPLGLTSARWQVLGAIELAGHPMSVAQIGRRMGVSRQSVQRIANDLKKLGFVTFEDNPDHARAKLIVLTPKGTNALNRIGEVQIKWSNALAKGLHVTQLAGAVDLLRNLQSRSDQLDLSQ